MKITFNKTNLCIYLAALTAVIVFASFYGGPIAYAPLFVLLLHIPVSVIYIFICFKFLMIYQEIEVHKLTKGEVHRYRAFFENSGLLPIHNMAIGVYSERCTLYEIPNATRISLDPKEGKELLSGINCLFAGAYDVGIENVSFSDPFRIFEITLRVPYTFRAIVNPRITDIAGRALDLENLFNNTGQKSYSLFEDTPGNDMRPYQKGDGMASVNWKVYAKDSELMVRVPDRMEKRSISIIMNAKDIPERDRDTAFLKARDYFLEFVVSSAKHFTDQGIPLTIIYPAGRIREITIDSNKSFSEFYNTVSDGLFYSSYSDRKELQELTDRHRKTGDGKETWITINEAPGKGEHFIDIFE